MKYSVKIETGTIPIYIAMGPFGFYTSAQPHDAHPFETRLEAAEATFRGDGLGLAEVFANPSDPLTIYPTEVGTVSSAPERHSSNFIGKITKA
jgi:hypothetical protein